MAGTPQQLWPIKAVPDTNKKIKTKNIKKHSDTRKLQLHTTSKRLLQQVIGRDKGQALLHFKQIDLNESGSSQFFGIGNS